MLTYHKILLCVAGRPSVLLGLVRTSVYKTDDEVLDWLGMQPVVGESHTTFVPPPWMRWMNPHGRGEVCLEEDRVLVMDDEYRRKGRYLKDEVTGQTVEVFRSAKQFRRRWARKSEGELATGEDLQTRLLRRVALQDEARQVELELDLGIHAADRRRELEVRRNQLYREAEALR